MTDEDKLAAMEAMLNEATALMTANMRAMTTKFRSALELTAKGIDEAVANKDFGRLAELAVTLRSLASLLAKNMSVFEEPKTEAPATEPAPLEGPSAMQARSSRLLGASLYNRVMGSRYDALDFTRGQFTVRVWDGMDGCWTDVAEATAVIAEIALATWMDKTSLGTVHVSFDEIDYYRIFPADTAMGWDGSRGREMFRDDTDEGEDA